MLLRFHFAESFRFAGEKLVPVPIFLLVLGRRFARGRHDVSERNRGGHATRVVAREFARAEIIGAEAGRWLVRLVPMAGERRDSG